MKSFIIAGMMAMAALAWQPGMAGAEDGKGQQVQVHREQRSTVQVKHVKKPEKAQKKAVSKKKRTTPDKAELASLQQALANGDVNTAKRRLKALRKRYPKWRPDPSLTNAIVRIEGEQQIWTLLGQHRIADAEAVMTRLQRELPGWEPSKKMKRVLLLAKAEPELWDMLHAGRLNAIHARLEELKKVAPDWKPSAAFRKEYRKARVDAGLARAYQRHDWKGVIKWSQAAPELFGCSGQYRRLKVAEAWAALGKSDKAYQVYAWGVGRCKETLNVEALEHAAAHLPPHELGQLLEKFHHRKLSPSAKQRVAAVELRYLLASGQPAAVVAKRAKAIEADLLARPDAAVARTLAWMYLDAGMHEDALRMFRKSAEIKDSAEAHKGELMALYRLGRWREFRTQARANQQLLVKHGMWQDLLPLLADACSHLQSDVCMIQAYKQLSRFRSLTTKEETSLAWAQYRTKAYHDAAGHFEHAYRADPTPDAAEGLRLSLIQAGEPLRLSRLANELDGPLAKAEGQEAAHRLYDKELYHAALAAGLEDPALRGADSPRLGAGWMHRKVSASQLTPALDQFELTKWPVDAVWFLKPDRWFDVRIESAKVDAGPSFLVPADHIGTGAIGLLPGAAVPAKTKWTGFEWDIGFRKQGWTSWEVRLGQGFRNGPLKATWKGSLEVKREFNSGWAQGLLYRQPVRSTMLSYIGLQAPLAPIIWGRVSRNGGLLRAYGDTGIPRLGLFGELGAETLDGVLVQSNSHAHASFSAPIHVLEDEWLLDIAPTLTWDHYKHDSNHFTIGHGGYFSPQKYYLFGLYGRLEHGKPGDKTWFRLSALWGRQKYYQAASLRFPLGMGQPGLVGTFWPAVTVKSSVLNARLDASVRLGQHWELRGSFRSDLSQRYVLGIKQFYRNQEAMLSLIWYWNERDGLLKDDPPYFGLSALE